MVGTKLCNRCWELETRIRRDPEIAEKILLQYTLELYERRATYPCRNCGVGILRMWEKDQAGMNGWRHVPASVANAYYHCDSSLRTHAEPNYVALQAQAKGTGGVRTVPVQAEEP